MIVIVKPNTTTMQKSSYRHRTRLQTSSNSLRPKCKKSDTNPPESKSPHQALNVFSIKKTPRVSEAEKLLAAIDAGDSETLTTLEGGTGEWASRPIPDNENGDTFLIYVLRRQDNVAALVTALIPPFMLTIATLKQVFAYHNCNHRNECALYVAATHNNIDALITGINNAAAAAHKSPTPFTTLIQSLLPSNTPSSSSSSVGRGNSVSHSK